MLIEEAVLEVAADVEEATEDARDETVVECITMLDRLDMLETIDELAILFDIFCDILFTSHSFNLSMFWFCNVLTGKNKQAFPYI